MGASTVKELPLRVERHAGRQDARTARTRSYKLAPPDGDSKYGAFLLQSWMWNRDTVFATRNLEDHVNGQILAAMRNNPNLLLDSDDLTRDGFESAVSEESVVCRARFVNGYPYLDVPSNMGNTHGLNVLGCFGRVLLNTDDVYEAAGFEIWPTKNVAFGVWLPAALAADGPLPAGKISRHTPSTLTGLTSTRHAAVDRRSMARTWRSSHPPTPFTPTSFADLTGLTTSSCAFTETFTRGHCMARCALTVMLSCAFHNSIASRRQSYVWPIGAIGSTANSYFLPSMGFSTSPSNPNGSLASR